MRKCSTFVLASFEHAKIEMRKQTPLRTTCWTCCSLATWGKHGKLPEQYWTPFNLCCLLNPTYFNKKKEVGLKLPNSSFIKSIKHHQMCDTPKSPNFTLHPNLHPKMLSHVFFPESCLKKQVHPMFPKKTRNHILVVGFNPCETYLSKWEPSPNRGENKSNLKPPPSIWGTKHIQPPK